MGHDKKLLTATIDVGAHSARMVVAQARPDMSFDLLELLEQPIPLGSDVYKRGEISADTINLLCDIFRNFRRKIDEYGVKEYRAIAASVVGEAVNAGIFTDRVELASGIRLDLFDGVDGARLDYLTVRNVIKPEFDFDSKRMLIADIGTGASQISFYDNGKIRFTQTIRIGTFRIMEEMPRTFSSGELAEMLAPFVARSFEELEHISWSLKADGIVAMGSSVRAMAGISGAGAGKQLLRITRNQFYGIKRAAIKKGVEKIASEHKISPGMAGAVTPCCMILSYLFSLTGASFLLAPMTATKDALLLDFIHQKFSAEDYFADQIFSMVERIAEKYRCNDRAAVSAALFAEKIFTGVKELHGMPDSELIPLKIAARLHKSGLFIGNRGYHKHSHYIISSTDIPGISARQRRIAALTARYHRKTIPRTSHLEFMSLPQDERVLVSKLAAILRLACGFAAFYDPEKKFDVRIQDGTVEIKLGADVFVSKDENFTAEHGDFFSCVFAVKLLVN
jgi:exopolyphosphatase/guanosine-5'-triphosphate,3'-diphosphate pyrophosphatase